MSTASNADRRQAATDARTLIGAASTAVLGTLDRQAGTPYASLVTVAASDRGRPIMLLSSLAMHTRNFTADPRASLLFSAGFGADDPLTLARVTTLGTVALAKDAAARAAYLARHPQAAGYADFGDFAFYTMAVERAHFIGGFGRIVELAGQDLLD